MSGETRADLPNPAPPGAPTSERAEQVGPEPTRHRLDFEEIGFIALLVLSVVGMAIADVSSRYGLWYWLSVIPIFGAVSVYGGWRRARSAGENVGAVLLRQTLHWGALAFAVYFIFVLERTGRLNREDAGLVALLALSLTAVLAGVHFDWRLAVLGILLAAVAAAGALVEEFFWILLIPAVLAGAGVVLWHRAMGPGARANR